MGSFFILLPYFAFHFFLLLLLTHFTSYTLSLCNHHDSSALLQFKNSFSVNTSSQPDIWSRCSSFSSRTESWKNNTDCCKWDGVTCDTESDYVIGLDLSCNNLKGELHPNSTIFQLRRLQQLNLAFNNFSWSSIPIGVGDLVKLTHLNLSNCYLNGNIPSTISHLSKLVSLDLSSYWYEQVGLKLNSFIWKKLIHNATNLRDLHLNGVNMSSIGESSLSMLKNLSSSLVSLSLRNTVLQGNISSDILSLPNLQRLDLSFNQNLSGQLPKSNWSTPLRYLDLSYTAFSGEIPYSIGQLKYLTRLDFSWCNFDGMVPLSLWNLTQLTYLDLSNNKLNGEISPLLSNLKHLIDCNLANNNFSGSIPIVYGNLIKLEYLALSSNNLTGQVPSSLFHLPHLSHLGLSFNKLVGPIPIEITKRSKLSYVFLDDNMLNGTIPHWCYSLPSLLYLDLSSNHLTGFIGEFSTYSLQYLDLSNNHLTGFIGEFSTYSLQSLHLSNNNLQGHFPNSIFQLQNLTELYLSSTNLSGVVDFHQFSKLKKLWHLVLSHNTFLAINTDSSADSILPNLVDLELSNANINSFPKFLAQLPNLQSLDLSNNNIHGKIPKWFHKKLLNSWKDIQDLDLSFNKLQGDLPIPPSSIGYFSLSNNNFTGNISSTFCNASSLYTLNLAHNNFQGDLPIPPDGIKNYLLSNNNFTGDISSTFCNASYLNVLNLAHNNLTGMIPQCLGTLTSLNVLDMQMNNLYGNIPRTFSKENAFQTIKLNGNQLEGPLPQSLSHCSFLEVLDLGDNNIEDTFPNWLETLQELQVLSLRSNNLHGAITCSSTKHSFPKLRIFDVSINNFSGPLPTSCIKNFQGMMNVNDSQIGLQYKGDGYYYNDSVVVTVKGFFIELTRILTAFTTIDLSNNMFEGEIPQVIGELNSLKGLNLSNNGITGSIPQSLGHLRKLEWLDLSCNQLTGEIPVALTNLNFLSVLKLSQNHLEGIIPKGQQFNTFGNDSYEGNTMLCGFPLSRLCKNDEDLPPHSTSEDEEESGFGWKAVAIGYGCGAISGFLLGYNVFFFTGKPQWLVRIVENMFNIRLKRTNNRYCANRRRMN
ncbi:putative leucine-rich repeat-containing, plant-type, leucine-rich repeat domain, L [Medicago truncatula]|uniref:Putative leucine-rich repeat-containing, plant-type, leucine-rich repeat domain, L n=1 Tax=Medicago truncatula TaxID=3880 RepID=G7KHD6_MEDTR|nr:receptor-like protein [Medicago truncatula]RHN57414.1 putative leucine-rich repeat-containing, plant-type, leucine-rich repeat domain, L [Medicago truncatula]